MDINWVNLSQWSLVLKIYTAGPLYRDFFVLQILNFTSDKNGYYRCQIFVNNSVSQYSPYVWLYATDNSSCTQHQPYFKSANPPLCAHFNTNTYSIPTTNFSLSSTSETIIATYSFSSIQSIMTSPKSDMSFAAIVTTTSQVAIGSVAFIAGILGALVLTLGILVIYHI